MITNELMSEIIGNPISTVGIGGNKKSIFYGNGLSPLQKINIHELAHKCKEWVLSDTEYSCSSGLSRGFTRCKIGDGYCMVGARFFFADTEPEAVFKGCEWILNER